VSIIICRKCGATTNTAVCDHMDSPDDMADGCYLKWENEWVKGCSYDDADSFSKHFCDKLLKGK
jgi:DTW domain-containing protein YfiP